MIGIGTLSWRKLAHAAGNERVRMTPLRDGYGNRVWRASWAGCCGIGVTADSAFANLKAYVLVECALMRVDPPRWARGHAVV